MFLIGHELSDEDQRFLWEVVTIVVALLSVLLSGPYTTFVVMGLGALYTFFVLWLLGQDGMKTFDEFTDGLMFRKPAIVLAAPGITIWHMY